MAQPTENIPMKDASLVDEFGICQSETPVVSICCITHNHEKFIRDALDGFLIQKTDFPIEIIVRDDASTDATATIVRQYQTKHPDLIRAIYHTQNQYALGKRAFPEVFTMARGKYIALCEGDDYWTDPLKLQKQVDFMEAHRECSISCHKVVVRHDDSSTGDVIFPNITGNQVFSKEDLYKSRFIRTASTLFINSGISKLIEISDGIASGDAALFYYYAQLGKIGFIDDCMAVYRVHDGGVWSGKSEQDQMEGLVDTRVKLRSRFRIRHSREFDRETLKYILKLLNVFNTSNNTKEMKRYLLISIPFLFRANKAELKILSKHMLNAIVPGKLHDVMNR